MYSPVDEIIKNLIKLRKVFLKNTHNSIFTDVWFKNEMPRSKLFLISRTKPKFLRRLFFLYIDDNYWKNLEFYLLRGMADPYENDSILPSTAAQILGYRDIILQIIFLVNGINAPSIQDRDWCKSLEDIIDRNLGNLNQTHYWFNKWDEENVDYSIKFRDKKSLIEQQNNEALDILKTAKLYIEAISVIWKFDEIKDKDSEDIDTFAVSYFTLHGLHKIIGGKSQSIRNLISQKVSKNEWKESEIDQINLHDFVLKQITTDRTKTEIKALKTKMIIEYLKKEDYVTSLDIGRMPLYIKHGRRILDMHSTNKDTIKQLEIELGVGEADKSLKVLGASEYIQEQIRAMWGDRNASFYKSDDLIHDLLEILNKHKEIITVDREFLEVKNNIDRVGLNKFYNKKEVLFNSTKPFEHLYLNHKAEFIKVISTINKIKELISSYDHLIILTESRNNLELVKPLAAISKYLLNENMEYEPVLTSLIVSYPINNLKHINKAMEIGEASKDSFQKDELKELKKSFDSLLYFDNSLFLEYLEDKNNYINFEDKDIKKFTQDEVANIIGTLSYIKFYAEMARFDNIDINMYNKFVKNMSRAGTLYINARNKIESSKGYIDERYDFQRREPKQNRKRLIIVVDDLSKFNEDGNTIILEENLKLLLNSKPDDEDEFIWLETDLSRENYNFRIHLIEI